MHAANMQACGMLRRDAWDTGVVSNIDGDTVRFFHTRDKGVDRVWVDHECFLAKASMSWDSPSSVSFCSAASCVNDLTMGGSRCLDLALQLI
jgi:hypothetical protein